MMYFFMNNLFSRTESIYEKKLVVLTHKKNLGKWIKYALHFSQTNYQDSVFT